MKINPNLKNIFIFSTPYEKNDFKIEEDDKTVVFDTRNQFSEEKISIFKNI